MKARRIGKAVLWVLGAGLLLAGLTASLLYAYQDKIIALFVAEANQHLKTKVQVDRIALSWWDKFPQVSVTLDQVRITEGLAGSQEPLATMGRIYCTFSLADVLRKNYRVRELYLENGQVHVKVLPDGRVNYQVFAQDTTAAPNQKFAFDLEKIALRNVVVSYTDGPLKQYYKATAQDLQAAMRIGSDSIALQTDGKVLVHTVLVHDSEYFKDKETQLRTSLLIRPDSRQVLLAPSVVQVGPASYQVQGRIDYDGPSKVDLQLRGQNTNVQSVLALLPARMSKPFHQYRSSGEAYFTGSVKGVVSGGEVPQVAFRFGCRQASLYHPDYKQQIKGISLTGTFSNGAQRNAASSVLALKNIKGKLANRPFSGNLVLANFRDPSLTLDLKADLDVGHVLGLFPVAEIRKGSGLAKVAVNFSGKLRQLKGKRAASAVSAGGDISLHNVSLALRDYRQPFRQLNGTFLIRKNDLAVNQFTGWLGASDFRLDGYFKNALAWFFLDKQSLLIEADFASRFLDLDQLLSSSQGRTGSGPAVAAASKAGSGASGYRLVIPPYFDFDINAHVERLQFRRLKGKALRGNIRLKNQVLSSPDIAFRVIGGYFGLQGYLDARSPNKLKVTTTARLRDLSVDSLFYVFENFGQSFLVQRHLKGELTANIKSDLFFDSYLNPQNDAMEAEVQVLLRNGQLNHFEPLQKLSAFASRRELANLRFAQLSNTFYIQRRTIFIPEMEIHSNVSRASLIAIQGTHTFDQQMDYHIRIPLQKAARRDKDEAYGRVEPVSQGGPNLMLTLKGNESNYKISYDKQRVKEKIAQDLKTEKKELLDVFKGKKAEKPAKPQTVEPSAGEFFDF
ncbi:MAG: AsmA-like C-terminal region-containing protein [Adhaeribacter sp.]